MNSFTPHICAGDSCDQCGIGTGSNKTVRDVMLNRMTGLITGFFPDMGMDRLAELVIEVTDEAFSVCGIPEREQQSPAVDFPDWFDALPVAKVSGDLLFVLAGVCVSDVKNQQLKIGMTGKPEKEQQEEW